MNNNNKNYILLENSKLINKNENSIENNKLYIINRSIIPTEYNIFNNIIKYIYNK